MKRFFKIIGPGFITGASDDDPSGIATYTQTGAQFGYAHLFTALYALPFMVAIQEMCGRIGLINRRGLGSVIKSRYGRLALYIAVIPLIIGNSVNIGADILAMAASAELVFGLPRSLWILLFAAVSIILAIKLPYKKYAKFLAYATLALLAYPITALVVNLSFKDALQFTFIPKFIFSKATIFNLVAILGTTFSPYLFFWQSSEEVEEENLKHRHKDEAILAKDLKVMKIDTAFGMSFSNLVMWFIIATAAATLYKAGVTNIESASDAAAALAPLAGRFSSVLFALGVVGTGMLAIPILGGSSAYAIAEARSWPTGLAKKFGHAKKFYLTFIGLMLLGTGLAFLPISPFKLLYYAAILNGVMAPIIMIFIVFLASDTAVVGRFKSSRLSQILGFGITGIMALGAIVGIIQLI